MGRVVLFALFLCATLAGVILPWQLRPSGTADVYAAIAARLQAADTSERSGGDVVPLRKDTDGDGWNDDVEGYLGSNPNDAASTPEHDATYSPTVPSSQLPCRDGLDNDGDGLTDGQDPGCPKEALSTAAFPSPPVLDIFASHAMVQVNSPPAPRTDFYGPTVVQLHKLNTLPGGEDVIDVEIVAMQLVSADPALPLQIVEDRLNASLGQVQAMSSASDFPATSFFDVYTEVQLCQVGEPCQPVGQRLDHMTNQEIWCLPPVYPDCHGFHSQLFCYENDDATIEHCPEWPPPETPTPTDTVKPTATPKTATPTPTFTKQFAGTTIKREGKVDEIQISFKPQTDSTKVVCIQTVRHIGVRANGKRDVLTPSGYGGPNDRTGQQLDGLTAADKNNWVWDGFPSRETDPYYNNSVEIAGDDKAKDPGDGKDANGQPGNRDSTAPSQKTATCKDAPTIKADDSAMYPNSELDFETNFYDAEHGNFLGRVLWKMKGPSDSKETHIKILQADKSAPSADFKEAIENWLDAAKNGDLTKGAKDFEATNEGQRLRNAVQ